MWTFQQSTGLMIDPNGNPMDTPPPGYSGNITGKNNPDAQDQHDVGPLPRGRYTIGPAYQSPKCGPLTMNLEPDPANQMFGRNAFRIHGDSVAAPGTASDGCIIQNHNTRLEISLSADRNLEVVE